MADGNFECKVHARRESKDGVYITLAVNPADLTPDLAMLRVGSALMVGWAEVVDTEVHPIDVEPMTLPQAQRIENQRHSKALELIANDKSPHDRKPFASLPFTQQAAIRCQDTNFQWFLSDTTKHPARLDWEPADEVRERCGVESRSFITKDTSAGDKWEALEREFQAWLVTHKYAESLRR